MIQKPNIKFTDAATISMKKNSPNAFFFPTELVKSEEKVSRSGAHQDRGCLRKKQKETERSGRNERENRRVIIIARHMTATKP